MQRVDEQDMAEIYRLAFNKICDPQDWKAPIECVVPMSTARLFCDAITFMTATAPEAYVAPHEPDMARITSIGYRAGPAGP